MKITFDNNNTNQNVDKVATTTYRDTRAEKTNRAGAYALDISGTVMDNTAYKGQGKTAEDVMQEAGQIDLATQRDYMTVMSNTMSEKDFNRMVEDGYQIGDMDVEEVVTIVDKIKAELIKGGTEVVGYTDQIDAGTLREITGSEAFAQELSRQFAEHDVPLTEENIREVMKAYAKASTLQEMTEGAAKYMVENNMEPTIDNLYLAGYSSTADGSRQGRGYYTDGAGYYAKKAEEYDWSNLRPQMEKILKEAGLEVNEESLEDAKWLIEKGIPLTPEAVANLYELNHLTLPQDSRQIFSAIVAAVADGKEAGEANLADSRSNLEKAVEYVERFAQITDEAVDKAVAEDQELTLVNLEAAESEIEAARQFTDKSTTAHADIEDDNVARHIGNVADNSITGVTESGAANSVGTQVPENITARRQLEEIRLMMTVEANRKLLESGYAIDTTELEQLVDALRQIESQQRQLMFGETDEAQAAAKASLYEETRSKVAEIPYLPIDIAGRFKVTDEDFTLDQVHIDGTALRNQYDEASEKYETWMTTTRGDLGDSIQKAFRSVDSTLEDLGLELNEENRRAVRILGYNRMELTQENIEMVRDTDAELHRVISKMTPAAVLQAIRDGKNPLEMTMPELNEYLDSIPYSKEQASEKYSKFLYKLDKNNAIDEQERTAYIGIYRMLRQFEKTDDAAVGALVNMGAEVSFKNMLSAVRSRKKAGMDFMVDDAFAGIDAIEKGMSISRQIESGFNKNYRDIVGNIADRMAKQDASTEKEYRQEQMRDVQQACEVEDAVIEELLHSKQPVTINNLAAADMLMNSRGALYKKMKEYTSPENEENVKDAVFRLHGALTDEKSAQEAFEEMEQVFEEVLEEAQYNPDISYIDLKAIQSCRKQLTLAAGLAKEENYQIPVEINGETTAIHLRVLHDKQDGGKVKATFETESHGKVAAEFTIRNGKISGYIACSTQAGADNIQGKSDSLQKCLRTTVEALAHNELELGDIGIVCSAELDLNAYTAEETQNGSSVQTADLYQIAKAFITVFTA
ncbi:MAG: hypothetical protein K2O65_00975 [Lachnospiraceae bacterium]|nr:hypothetical protein [Lachnospiraceae bacterium]